MRVRSKQWTKLAARGSFTMETKARIGGVDYTAISAPKIDRSMMSAPLSIGNCTSATLSLSILTDDEILSTNPIVIMGRLTNGTLFSEWKEFGTFFINQRDTSYAGLVTVDCFDAMLKANQNYVDDDSGASEWPKSMKSVVSEIAYRIGVGVDPRTKINTGEDYYVPFPSGKTMIQVLGDIGACHGGNWIITEDNLLRLIPLRTSPDETFHIINEDFEKIKTVEGDHLAYMQQVSHNAVLPPITGETPTSEIPITHYIIDEHGARIVTSDGHVLIWAEDGSVDAIDGLINIPVVCGELKTGDAITVTGVKMTNEAGNSYTAGNDNGFVITIEGNPYATQGICDSLFSAFNGLVYCPFTATKALYDPATELGDQVKIGDKVHSVIYNTSLVLDLNFRSDIDTPNSEELTEEYPYLSEIKKLKQSSEELNTAIQETATELAESISETDSNVDSLAASLRAEVTRASGAEQTLSTNIGGEIARAQGAEAALSGRIASLESGLPSNAISRLSELETIVGGHTTSISGLSGTVSQHDTDIAQNTDDIADLSDTVDDCLDLLGDLDDTATAYGGRILTLESIVAQHSTLISILQNRVLAIENTTVNTLNRLNVIEGGGNALIAITVSLLPSANTYRLGDNATVSAENQTELSISRSNNTVTISGDFSALNSFSMSNNPSDTHKWGCLVIDTGESDITTVSVNGDMLTAGDIADAALVDITSGSFVLWVKTDELINIPITLTFATSNKTSVSVVFRFTDTGA